MGNPVVHFELIGPDPTLLREFYAELFGWDAPAGAPVATAISAPTEYSFISPDGSWGAAAGGIGGGVGFSAHALFYVGVDNVARLSRLRSASGQRLSSLLSAMKAVK